MTTPTLYNVETFAQDKKKKYEALTKRALNNNDGINIDVVGMGTGKYYKVDDYYIKTESNDNQHEFYITKEKFVKDNNINAWVLVTQCDGIIKSIKYQVLDIEKKEEQASKNHNLNGVIVDMSFEKDGKLSSIHTEIDECEYLMDPETGISLIGLLQRDNKNLINKYLDELEKPSNEKTEDIQETIDELMEEDRKLERIKASFRGLDNKKMVTETGRILDACAQHITQFYAVKRHNKKIGVEK